MFRYSGISLTLELSEYLSFVLASSFCMTSHSMDNGWGDSKRWGHQKRCAVGLAMEGLGQGTNSTVADASRIKVPWLWGTGDDGKHKSLES